MSETDWWNGAFWQKHYGSFSKNPPDFYGPSGFTRLTVTKDQAKFEFVPIGPGRTDEHPHRDGHRGVLASAILANPAPSIGVDKGAFMFQTSELQAARPGPDRPDPESGRPEPRFHASSPSRSWLKVSPASGTSVGEWIDVTVTLASKIHGPRHLRRDDHRRKRRRGEFAFLGPRPARRPGSRAPRPDRPQSPSG